MFDNLIKELGELDGTQVSVPLHPDAEGYQDHECPSPQCLFGFKIHADDWRDRVRDEVVFCPSCRHTAPATEWFTRDQVEQAKDYAFAVIEGRIDQAMRQDATNWNRRQPRGAMISITLSVEGVSRSLPMPIAAAEPLRLRTTCDECGCRYSFIGAAFFCPACGANSARHTFQQTLSTIRTAARSRAILRAALERDDAELLVRSLLEKGCQDAVMSFQRLCEQLHDADAPETKLRKNTFQSLDAGSDAWSAARGVAYGDFVQAEELSRLRIYFQQRHLLAHRNGIVDQEYVDRSGDRSYAPGQRLVLSEGSVSDFVSLIEKLGLALLELQR
jgi:hypothetical protein